MMLALRQICSIESAARNNPNFDIFLLFSSPRYSIFDSIQKEILRLKLNYKNIFFRNNNIWRYAQNSSVIEFLENGQLFNSWYLPYHMSDLLRILSIWKYGAIYMDTDIILKKSLEKLGLNFVGTEEFGEELNGALIGLAPNGSGHFLGEMLINEFIKNYNPYEWAANGPQLISEIVRTFCNVTNLNNVSKETCPEINIYPKDTFWSLNSNQSKHLFNPLKTKILKYFIKNSYLIHFFNHITKDIKNKVRSKNLFNFVAKKNCPVTYKNAGKFL